MDRPSLAIPPAAVTVLLPLLLLVTAAFSNPVRGQPASDPDEIRLTVSDADRSLELIFADEFESRSPLIQRSSGWPLTAVLTANEQKLLGIGVPISPPFFPERGTTGFLVFDDPDGCPSFIADEFQQKTEDCPAPPWPFDESWVEFTSGLTVPGTESGDRPQVFAFNSETDVNENLNSIGPTGLTDDYNYGPNPRVPGLVVVADAGPSIITSAAFDRPAPMKCRNLAGFASSVGYELRDANNRTSITVHFNVPRWLFTPVAQVDRHVSTEGACDDTFNGEHPNGTLLRIDGGPETCIEGTPLNALDPVVNEQEVTARLFVVNAGSAADAPNTIEDLNGNGICDADDARLAGHTLLSTEQTVLFRQIHELYFGVPFDFDLDGDVGTIVAPAGAGQLTQPPR